MATAAPGGALRTKLVRLPVIAAPVRVVQRSLALRRPLHLVMAGAALTDDILHERRRIGARDLVRGMAPRARGRPRIILRQLHGVDAPLELLRHAGVAVAARAGNLLLAHRAL